ncbi:hypothetical protein GV794_13820, partial [Nocardia cyriacigeorgica]
MRAPTTRQRLAAIAGRVLTTVLAVLATLLFSYLLLHATGPTPSTSAVASTTRAVTRGWVHR